MTSSQSLFTLFSVSPLPSTAEVRPPVHLPFDALQRLVFVVFVYFFSRVFAFFLCLTLLDGRLKIGWWRDHKKLIPVIVLHVFGQLFSLA